MLDKPLLVTTAAAPAIIVNHKEDMANYVKVKQSKNDDTDTIISTEKKKDSLSIIEPS